MLLKCIRSFIVLTQNDDFLEGYNRNSRLRQTSCYLADMEHIRDRQAISTPNGIGLRMQHRERNRCVVCGVHEGCSGSRVRSPPQESVQRSHCEEHKPRNTHRPGVSHCEEQGREHNRDRQP
jgi:hypothetical protein